jgi:hypothetical protein
MKLVLRTGEYVQNLPRPRNPTLNCHSICRALSMCISELKVVDGRYLGVECVKNEDPDQVGIELKNCHHSWLVTPDGAIIDPYPVGFIITNPLLIGAKGDYTFYGYKMYFPDPRVAGRVMTRSLHRASIVLAKYMMASKAIKSKHFD